MPKLCAENLKVAYGDHEIIKNLNLNIPAGKMTAIIGFRTDAANPLC